MNEFLNSLKADLTDRRLLPLVALVLVALLGAVAYAVLGGGSSSSTPSASISPAPIAAVPGGLSTSQTQPGTQQAVAETTSGASAQQHGRARNPFTQLPGSAKATAATTTSTLTPKGSGAGAGAASGSTTTTSTTGSSTRGGGESSTAGPSKPPAPAKPKTLYKVALQFGVLGAGETPANAQLKAYVGLTKATPLPSGKGRLVEFLGVTVGGHSKSATFALDSELLPQGSAACLPSAVQCKVLNLKEGSSEQLVGVLPNGEAITYELRVVSIESASASSASVKSVLGAQARTARTLLQQGGLLKLAGLRYSSLAGVLVFAGHRAFGARAHTSARRRRRG